LFLKLFFAVFVLAVIVIDAGNFRAENLVSATQPWTATGSFTKDGPDHGAYLHTKFDIGIAERERQRVDFWGSWAGSDANVGEIRSPVFPAPAILECFLAGYPGKPGLGVYLERADDHQRFALTIAGNSYPGEIWRPFHWRIPAAFRGQPVQLVAVDQATGFGGWMGVSTPRRFSYLALLHQQLPHSLTLIGRSVLSLAVFLLPGFAISFWIIHRWPELLRYALMLIVSVSAALGYVCFYVYFFSRPGGRFFSLAIAIVSLVLLVLAFRRGAMLRTMARQVAEPFALTAATAACYLCFAFLFVSPAGAGAEHINVRFFSVILPGDNIIPRIFADKIYNREPLHPFCCGDWLSSDRPPLQTGIFLLERRARWIKNADFEYELLGTALQCLWIAGVWAFLSSLGTAPEKRRWAILFLIFSGPVFFNCVYPWPKFLAATFILFTVSIVIQKLRNPSVAARPAAIVASVCLGLALVSHPTGVYSLSAFPILLWRYRQRLPRLMLVAVPIVLAFVLPWIAYQKLADPPGDRLIKWHLAGHPEPDSLTAWQELRKAYTSHTVAQIAALRWGNVVYLFSGAPTYPTTDNALENERQSQREFFFQAIGVLNLGFFAMAYAAWRGIRPAVPFAGWIILAVLLNLAVWCCLEFGPKMTPLIHSSYADFLMLSLGLLGFLLALPRLWIIAAFVLQVLNTTLLWVWSPPYAMAERTSPINTVMLQIPLLVFGILIALALIFARSRASEQAATGAPGKWT